MTQRWYTGATRGMWLALAAALLGWMFDGFEMGVFPLVAKPALAQLLAPDPDQFHTLMRQATYLERQTAAPGLDAIAQQALRDEAGKVRKQALALADGELVRQWNGVIYAAFLLGASLGGFAFGWLGDRVGRVRAMALSVLTYALFTGLCGLALEPWHLAALRFVAALGMGGEWALGVALVMEKWAERSRPVLAGLIGAAANFGFLCTGLLGLVLQPAGTWLLGVGESEMAISYWRIILGLCVLPAVLTFFIRLFVPESEKWQEAVASGPKPGLGDIFGPTLWRRSLLGLALAGIALLATWGGVQMIPQWVGGKEPSLVPWVNICSSAGAIVGSFFGAVLGERLGRRFGYVVLCALSLAVCQALFLGFAAPTIDAGTTALVSFFTMVALVGLCSASFYGWLPLYLPELFPTRVRAAGQGFAFNGGRIVAAAGVIVTAFAIDLSGKFEAAAAIVCSVYVLGVVLAMIIPETKGRPLPD